VWPTSGGLQPKPVRIAYDPSVSEMTCWVEGRLVCKQKLTGSLPKQGKHLTISTVGSSNTLIQSIRVVSGVAPPAAAVGADATDGIDTIVMNDGQRHTGESVVLTPQGIQLQTAAGRITLARADVAGIMLARRNRERPRRSKGDVRIHAASHVLTMQLTDMTATALTGTSVLLGAVKVDRASVRLVKLNIYVPDNPPAVLEPKEPPVDPYPFTLRFKSGMVLPVDVVGIARDGKVRFRTAFIDGVASVLPGQAQWLGKVAAIADDPSALALILTNGDRVAGELVEVADDGIVVDGPATGEVKLKRSLVQCIMSTSGQAGSLWSEFSTGILAPWRPKPGMDARIWDGALRSTARSRRAHCVVAAPVKQDGPSTIQVEVGRGGAIYPLVTLWLHASDWQRYNYASGIRAGFSSRGCFVSKYSGGRSQHLGGTAALPLVKGMMSATYTVAFDPAEDEIKVWVGAKLMGKFSVGHPLQPGREVAMNLESRTHILRVNVRPGVHPPIAVGDVPANQGRVVFENGDSVLVKGNLSVVERQLVVPTPDGEMRCPLKNVARIDLPVARSTLPRRNKADVRVRMGRAVLTMQIIEMTETTLHGRSDYLGEVRLPRKLLRGIEFAVHP